jgi:hypothetical protein
MEPLLAWAAQGTVAAAALCSRVDVPRLHPLLSPFKTTAQLLVAAAEVVLRVRPTAAPLAIWGRAILPQYGAAGVVAAADQATLPTPLAALVGRHQAVLIAQVLSTGGLVAVVLVLPLERVVRADA